MAERIIPFNQLGKAGYNRGINRAHVNKIKRDFHEDMVQPAIVSFRDKRYWIIDHQHQTQAIYERNNCDPNTPIRCDVRTGLTYEEEADLYYRLNTGSKPLAFADKMVGLIESKDGQALDFRDTVESFGYVIGGNTNRSLKAISRVWSIFNKEGGKETLSKILSITRFCWPDNPNGVDSRIMDGLVLFLEHHENEYQAVHLIKALASVDPHQIVKNSTTFYKQMDSKAFTMPYCTYTVILNSYNSGLRNKLVAATPGAWGKAGEQ